VVAVWSLDAAVAVESVSVVVPVAGAGGVALVSARVEDSVGVWSVAVVPLPLPEVSVDSVVPLPPDVVPSLPLAAESVPDVKGVMKLMLLSDEPADTLSEVTAALLPEAEASSLADAPELGGDEPESEDDEPEPEDDDPEPEDDDPEPAVTRASDLILLSCSFQGTVFALRIDTLTRLNRKFGAVPGSMDCR